MDLAHALRGAAYLVGGGEPSELKRVDAFPHANSPIESDG
jgi:hypothetical protein